MLAKRAPTNKVDAEYQSGAIHVDEKAGVYELHVTDGHRGAVVLLDHDEIPSDKPNKLVSGQIPAPAIKLMQGDGAIESADKDEIVVWSEKDEVEVSTHRDSQLVDTPQDVRALIPDIDSADYITEIVVDAKRLKELAEAMGTDKVVVTAIRDGDKLSTDAASVLHVRPLAGGHVGFIKQAERPRPKSDAEPEATEPLIED